MREHCQQHLRKNSPGFHFTVKTMRAESNTFKTLDIIPTLSHWQDTWLLLHHISEASKGIKNGLLNPDAENSSIWVSSILRGCQDTVSLTDTGK